MNPPAILHIRALMHGHYVSQTHAKILPDCLVHPDLRFLARVIDEHNADGVSPFLALYPAICTRSIASSVVFDPIPQCSVESRARGKRGADSRDPFGSIGPHLQQDGVATEELQLFHRFVVERDDRVVIVHGIIHDQPVRTLLPFQDGCAEVFLLPLFAAGPIGARCPFVSPRSDRRSIRNDSPIRTFRILPLLFAPRTLRDPGKGLRWGSFRPPWCVPDVRSFRPIAPRTNVLSVHPLPALLSTTHPGTRSSEGPKHAVRRRTPDGTDGSF